MTSSLSRLATTLAASHRARVLPPSDPTLAGALLSASDVHEFAARYDEAFRDEVSQARSTAPESAGAAPSPLPPMPAPEPPARVTGMPGMIATSATPASTAYAAPPAVDETQMTSRLPESPRDPLPFSGHAQLPAAIPLAPPQDTGTLFLSRGAPSGSHSMAHRDTLPASAMTPAPNPPGPSLGRETVALRPGVAVRVEVPFTMLPSQAPLAPSTPFQALPLPAFAAIVAALERGQDPMPLFAAHRLDFGTWTALSRDMFARSMNDPTFSSALEQALRLARGGR